MIDWVQETAAFALAGMSLIVIYAVFIRPRHRQDRVRKGALVAALSTLSGVCYDYDGHEGIRIDGQDQDEKWPLRLSSLMASLGPVDGVALTQAIHRLCQTENRFLEKFTTLDGRVLEFSGFKSENSNDGRPFHLIWCADASAAERDLREREANEKKLWLLARVVQALPIALWYTDESGQQQGLNPRFTHETGLAETVRQLSGVGKVNQGTVSIGHHKNLQADVKQTYELIEISLDGEGRFGFALNRSETEDLKTELIRVAHGHQQVLEAINVAIAIWGPDKRLLFSNSAFGRLWRFEPEWLEQEPTLPEVLDRLRERRLLPEYADFPRFKHEQVSLFESLIGTWEELLHLPDDRTVRLHIARHPFGGLIFTYEDVTDKLALERSYNTLTEVQRETLDNLSEGIAVFGSDGRLKLWNPAFCRIWQLQPEDLNGKPHVGLLVEKARHLYINEVNWETTRREAISRATSYAPYMKELERQDGSTVRINAVPLPDGNMLLTYLDVTDSVRVERFLRERNEELLTADGLKSEFIANVSYELRTPLNAISGFAEMLSNQYFGELNLKQMEYCKGILDSSSRLSSLVNDILDLATIEAGQFKLESGSVDIHGLLASILSLSRERVRRSHLSLHFECPPDIGFLVCDERRLRQALFNLVTNSVKFTPAGGTITLKARRDGQSVAISVHDTGVGIASEHHGRIFNMFERGDTKTRHAGAGLGLSLVKSFIELHGGHVELESNPGEGTTVTCWLPVGGE